jgi:hypothetical protein
MKKITLITFMFFSFLINSQEIVFEDGFETYDEFAIDNVGSWTLIDVDGLPTYGFEGVDFPEAFGVKSYQVFNNNNTTPPLEVSDTEDWTARTGNLAMVCFAAVPAGADGNDDWLISPEINLGTGGSTLSFWYKATSSDFSLEEFSVGVSTTGTNPEDFTIISADPVQVTNGGLVYEEFTADLTSFEGSPIYIGIRCTSFDQFGFMVDDFQVTSETLSIDEFDSSNFNYFVDAQNYLNLSANKQLQNLSIHNLLGQEVLNQKLSSQNETVNLNALTSGVYLAKVQINGASKTFKVMKR